MLAHALADGARYDALLVTGDIVHDEPGGYRHFRVEMLTTGLPVYCLPGNHDVPAAAARGGGHTASRSAGTSISARGASCCSTASVPGHAHGHLQAARNSSGSSARWPPPAGATYWSACTITRCRTRAAGSTRPGCTTPPTCSPCSTATVARALVWGHVHQEFEALRRGVRLLGVPSTCAQFLAAP
ncbi:MAG: metallophosphoesterase [Rubrivivax sp.]